MARRFGALIGAAALLGALPAPALAGGRHHDDRGHHGRGHDRDCDHGRGHAYGRKQVVYAPRYHPAPRRVYVASYRPPAPSYYCGRCRAHFASHDGLYGHVHLAHRIPTWQLPGVVAQVSFGWAFGL